MSLDALGSSPATICIAGHELTISRIKARHLSQVQAHVVKQSGNPVEKIKPSLEGLDEESKKYVLGLAYDDYRRQQSMTLDDLMEFLSEIEGFAYLLWLLARDHQPDMTLEQAEKIVGDLDFDKFEGAVNQVVQASGLSPDPTT